MKNFLSIFIIFTAILTSGYTNILEEKTDGISTQQPYKVELIDNKTPQLQYALTLKVANDTNLNNLKVGEKFLFVMPSDLKLESGGIIKAGTKFSATIVMKKNQKNQLNQQIKFIINEIIFDDTTNFIILSNPHGIAPLKSISTERILGKGREVTGTFRLGTVISNAKFSGNSIKLKPDTTTAVGICILAKTTKFNAKLEAGTLITITFVNNLKPEVGIIKYTVRKSYY